MLHHLKLAFRQLTRQRLTTSLNVLGLGIGMAAFLLIQHYVQFEQNYDNFYRNSEKVFRLTTHWGFEGDVEAYATTPPPLADVVRDRIPEIEAVCRVFYWSDFTFRPDNDPKRVFRETKGYAVDADFFQILDYGLLAGDPATALSEPASIVLPKSAAIRYFGEEAFAAGNVLGRELRGGKDGGTTWKVTGVMADQPANSHLQYDVLISANTYPDDLYRNQVWTWNVMHTYVRTSATSGAEKVDLQAKLKAIAEEFTLAKMEFAQANPEQLATVDFDYKLQPVQSIHLTSDLLREMRPNGNATYVNVMSWAAFLILFMAIANFINLATAQATRQAKVVSMQKILGARFTTLLQQSLGLSVLTAALAGTVAIALCFAWTLAPKNWLDITALNTFQLDTNFLIKAGGLVLLTGLLAGIYPAFYLGKIKVMGALQGQQIKGLGDRQLRHGLVVFQLVLSMLLVGGSWVVLMQVEFFQNKELGFAKNNLLVIENDREMEEQKDVFKEELMRHPGITAAGFSNGLPGQSTYQMRNFRAEGREESTGINYILADDSFLPTLSVELLQGENFQRLVTEDSTSIILNESAAAILGLAEPLGHVIIKNEGRNDEERLRVIGLVKDFHLQGLHQNIEPLAFGFFKNFVFKDYISVRLNEQDPAAAIAHVEARWDAFEPGVPLRYHFLDENYNRLFASEVQLGKLFGLFTGLALLIAGLGLFGLVSLLLSERVKEIGIRKVLGASVGQITYLFSRQFLLLVGIAFLVAAPVIYWGSEQWLQNFAYQSQPGIWPIVLALVGTLALTAITVSVRSAWAAQLNPVDALQEQ